MFLAPRQVHDELERASPDARVLVTDRDMRGHRLHVEGALYTGIRTLHLASFTDRGTAGLSASLLPAATFTADH